MASKSINDLPVELHNSILKYLLLFSCTSSLLISESHVLHVESDLPLSPVEFEWTEKNIRSSSLFPFNAALASKSWRDILALIPGCWTRVVFDVAKDPTPLLNAFLWSKNLEKIEVFVFNSDDTQIVDGARERSFVSAIAESLQPHIHRCKSIIFNVTYVTSLPPPIMFFIREAPHLAKLSLNCRIDNLDLPHNQMKVGPRREFATSFPKLNELSLTGFWFMYLVLHASKSDWLGQLTTEPFMSLYISHFTFHRHGQYSLPEFAAFISKAAFFSVHFRDLSLAYSYDSSEPKPDSAFKISSDFHFHAVSKDFIGHLYAITDFCSHNSLSFEACEIPKLKMTQSAQYLKLTNIIDDDEGSSLRHILEVWAGCELLICSCPLFNDTLLCWFTSKISNSDNFLDITFPAKRLNSLSIVNCDNFSSRAVQELVYLCSKAKGQQRMDLIVYGKGPVLSGEDKIWFEQNSDKMAVYWEVTDNQGKKNVFKVSRQYFE